VDADQDLKETYRLVTPPEIQSKMDAVEADVQVLRKFISDDE
jgi:hypothetical protein